MEINIKLSAHDAIILASFHNEFMQDLRSKKECLSLLFAVNNFMEQVCMNMPENGLEDAKAEVAVNKLIGKAPLNTGGIDGE
jgi:hypothetical protein